MKSCEVLFTVKLCVVVVFLAVLQCFRVQCSVLGKVAQSAAKIFSVFFVCYLVICSFVQ